MPIRRDPKEVQRMLIDYQFIFERYRRLGSLLKKQRAIVVERYKHYAGVEKRLEKHTEEIDKVREEYWEASDLLDKMESGTLSDICEKLVEYKKLVKPYDYHELMWEMEPCSVTVIPDNLNAQAELDEFLEEFQKKYITTKIYKNA